MCWLSKALHSYQIWYKLVELWENGISFSKFKLAAAIIVNSGHQAFIVIIDVLIFKVATYWSNLVKIDQTLRERHQFFEIQHYGRRHFEKYLSIWPAIWDSNSKSVSSNQKCNVCWRASMYNGCLLWDRGLYLFSKCRQEWLRVS